MSLADKPRQLKDYVSAIAATYREDNPFHNFEHASHVTMSVVKLLGRIVAPDVSLDDRREDADVHHTLHDHTYGMYVMYRDVPRRRG